MATLIERINTLKFKYKLQSTYGEEATLLLVPRSDLRKFCNALVDELGAEETGPAHHVYHFLSTGEREMSVCDLDVRLYEGEDLAVGNPVQ
jgi:hypothetical protein